MVTLKIKEKTMPINYQKKLEYDIILNQLSSHAITYLGKDECSHLQPSSSLAIVANSINETTEAVTLLHQKKHPPLVPINNLSLIFKQLESNLVLSAKSLLECAKLLRISQQLCNYFFTDKDSFSFPILEGYFNQFYSNQTLHDTISKTILDENTIADDASDELASIRKKQRNLEETIKEKLEHFIHSSTYSKYIQENLVTIRNSRYVIPVKDEYRSQINGFIHDTSASGSTVFIEPVSIFELNNQIHLLKVEETKEIETILIHLTSLVVPIQEQLKTNLTLIGKLDFIFAKASYAISLNATKPILSNTKYICLKAARHPLIDKNMVVPIDLELGKDFSTLVITGPNTGGKTVALKTVGLLTLMACSGLHIPATEGSEIYVFDHIFADIGDEQSIQESLSTFSSHMSNIVQILTYVTSNSLVLLDELGAGTDPVEGSSLAISILEELFNKNCLTISTTHYQEVKSYTLVTKGFENASVEFDLEKLQPTYHLLLGVPGKSNAFAISEKLGLSPSLIQRATTFIDTQTISMEELLKNIYDTKRQIELEELETKKNLHQAEELRKTLEQKNRKVSQKESELIEKAKKEARTILLEAKQEASSIIHQLNQLSSSDSLKQANQIRNNLNETIKHLSTSQTSFSEVENTIPANEICIGMSVFIPSLNQSGMVLSNPNKSNQVQVQIGSAKMILPVSSLHPQALPKKPPTVSSSMHINKAKVIHSEINVIGSTVEEATFVIDKFLDDASLSKLNTIRIVHGKGTGALRNRYSSFFKRKCTCKVLPLRNFW